MTEWTSIGRPNSTWNGAAPPFVSTVDTIISAADYDTMADILTAVGADNRTVYINKDITISSTTTLSTNLSTIVVQGAKFYKAGTGALVVNGSFAAGLYEVFSGFSAGEITFGAGSVNRIQSVWGAGLADSDNFSLAVSLGNSHDHNGGDGATIDHVNVSNKGTNTHAQIDTHIASTSNPHTVAHSQLADKGTNTHAVIDGLFTNEVAVENYASLAAAITAIGSSAKTLVISSPITLTANATIPSTLSLNIRNGGSIAKASTYTLTLNGPFSAGLYQVFSGFSAGDVTFGAGAVKEAYPQWWYTGSGSYTTAATIALAAHKRVAFVGNGNSYDIATAISTPDDEREIVGYGKPILTTSAANTIISHAYHKKLTVDGIKFTGNGHGIVINPAAVSAAILFDYHIKNCEFEETGSTIWAIRLIKPSFGYIDNCKFNPQSAANGIYSNEAMLRWVRGCLFQGNDDGTPDGKAIWDDGQGSAYSIGTYLADSNIMGFEYGVLIQQCDDFQISGSTIDTNKHSIRLLGQDTGTIFGNYIGANAGYTGGTGAQPALYIGKDSAVTSAKIKVYGNTFVGQLTPDGATDTDFDNLYADSVEALHVHDNDFTFWTRYGINYTGLTFANISGNYFTPRLTYGTADINVASDDASNKIMMNHFAGANTTKISGTLLAQPFNNRGFVTELTGTGTIASGNTNVVVTHQLNFTPAAGDITIQRYIGATTNPVAWWFASSFTSTQFTVYIDADPGASGFNFTWQARKGIY